MDKYILIVDDSPTIRISIEFAIKELGYRALQAENGIDALGKAEEIIEKDGEIALCITDINMPQMDGITFINEFRKKYKFIPIIVITTESADKKIQEGKSAGASGWIVKPFQPSDLLNVVNRFLK